MKKAFGTLLGIVLFHSIKGQNIGLRANTIFSDKREINNAFGGGIYVNIEDSLKFGCVLFADYLSKSKDFDDCSECLTKEVSTNYKNFSFGISGSYRKKIYNNSNFNFGPLINLNMMDLSRLGQITNWIETFKVNSIGTGILLNLQFQQVLELPLNFDVFITPIYLINFNSNIDPPAVKTGFTKNLTVLNIQIGLAYLIR